MSKTKNALMSPGHPWYQEEEYNKYDTYLHIPVSERLERVKKIKQKEEANEGKIRSKGLQRR